MQAGPVFADTSSNKNILPMRARMADQQSICRPASCPLLICTRINLFLYFNEQRPDRKSDRAVKERPGKYDARVLKNVTERHYPLRVFSVLDE